MDTLDSLLPIPGNINILLADDDKSDCLLFREALEELPVSAQLSIVHDGEQLMARLDNKEEKQPDVLFLDLNMPRKNGLMALGEIKRNNKLDRLPVIIFSTADETNNVRQVFRDAAHYYIKKPAEFAALKKVIHRALTLITQSPVSLPGEENFMLTGDVKSQTNEARSPAKKSSRKTD